MAPLLSRWYAFGPWVLIILLIWRQFGWRRAIPVALGGWLIAFSAEWASTGGPGVPFGAYTYRTAGLTHDWRVLGVPIFDSLSFTWLAFCTYTLAGALGARGTRRLVLAALAMVAIDVVVDPVALRGAHWWLGSIYAYPGGAGVWYGVSAFNYLGWLVVGLALQLWVGCWLGGVRGGSRLAVAASAVLVAGVIAQSTVLAMVLGIGPSALLAVAPLAGLGIVARGMSSPAPPAGRPLVLVACALSSEARAARHALGRGWVGRPAPGYLRWSRRRHPTVEIWETGMGLAAAAEAARLAPGGTAVLVAGVGGACSGDWPPGSVGIGSRVLAPGGAWLQLDLAVHDRLVAGQVGRTARLGSRAQAADRRGERAELAGQGVDIVEMETAAWASSRSPGATAPLAALRTVVDTPSLPLGAAATLVAPGSAGPSPLRVARLLFLHPASLARLIEVGRRQRLAVRALGRAVAVAVPVLERMASEAAAGAPHGRQDDRTAVSASRDSQRP